MQTTVKVTENNNEKKKLKSQRIEKFRENGITLFCLNQKCGVACVWVVVRSAE